MLGIDEMKDVPTYIVGKKCPAEVVRVRPACVLFPFFFRGAELEKSIAEVRGGDEATALRRLTDLLRSVHSEFKVARRLGESAVEAAAKCQVRPIAVQL